MRKEVQSVRQLIVYADMEGASGIFDRSKEACRHAEMYPGGTLWREYGRACITSDVLAVCEAAADFGIDDILLYDAHYAGCAEHNVMLEKLPEKVRVFDVPNREFHWRRIRGQAEWEPYGIVTVGQHARFGEPDAYFAHTIQSPPIKAFWVNQKHIAEIGTAVLSFRGTPCLAKSGCAASHREAKELASTVSCITVKDKRRGWEPSPQETYPLIYSGVLDALQKAGEKLPALMDGACRCSMELTEGFRFAAPESIPWKGSFAERTAVWEAPYFEMAMELFNEVRACIVSEQS